ncbi:MAG: acetyltransferase [Balneolaceae bacterium]
MVQSTLNVAEIIKNACIEAARDGFRDASMSGLCTEGAMEAAISAIQKLDVEEIVKKHSAT